MDLLPHRHRLWSWRESQLVHLWRDFRHARDVKLFKNAHLVAQLLGVYLDSVHAERQALDAMLRDCAARAVDQIADAQADTLRGGDALVLLCGDTAPRSAERAACWAAVALYDGPGAATH